MIISPADYLANTQLPTLAKRSGAAIVYRPFRLPTLMKQVGNRPTTVECMSKLRYAGTDLARWSRKYGVPLQHNPHLLAADGDELLRGVLVAAQGGKAPEYTNAVFEAMWNGTRDLSQRATLIETLEEAGLEATKLLERTTRPESIDMLECETAGAVERGVFGAPSFLVEDELFFGNDRLDFVAAALAA
ncbi:MAG: 2-hydroxychromene-2-carboxylate isomerase [Myxococcales bacterium]|nr:2-hydroxychromene-2-carboxylate isomerase [Myxococcales bacterium]